MHVCFGLSPYGGLCMHVLLQWVDVTIPGVAEVGGFSLCSAPHSLPFIELVVKRPLSGEYAPAQWFHTDQPEGAQVSVRAGGSFSYDPVRDAVLAHGGRRHLALVGGGIGISPLRSIAHTCTRWVQTTEAGAASKLTVSVAYGASEPSELVFANDLLELQTRLPDRMHTRFTVAECPLAAPSPWAAAWDPVAASGRFDAPRLGVIDSAMVAESLVPPRKAGTGADDSDSGESNALVLVCGPPPMTDAVVEMCDQLGVPSASVLFEKWW